MKNEMNIKWHKFDREDPNTFPKDEDKQYLVTYRRNITSEMDITLLPWSVVDQWRLWEFDGCKILFWSEFNVRPCTESGEQEEPEVEGSDVEYRTVTLRELSRSHKLDVNTLVAVKNALKKKLEWLENPFGEGICTDSVAREAFLSQCTEVEDRFEHRPEIPQHESLCYLYNELLRNFAKMHPVLSDSVNGIEITIEW